jgi:hypothetical protein
MRDSCLGTGNGGGEKGERRKEQFLRARSPPRLLLLSPLSFLLSVVLKAA